MDAAMVVKFAGCASRVALIVVVLLLGCLAYAEEWPALPSENGSIAIPAQEWPFEPGQRTVPVHIRYPGKAIANVGEKTGLMLSLHNWGGRDCDGAPDPLVLADKFDLVVISVDYVQSGKYNPETDPPYDYGYLQALDALRALYAVWSGLDAQGIAYDKARIYSTGGSGGGNVTLMCNKLAPRTFAAIVNLSGMVRLTDDIAYGMEGGSKLNAGYSQDPSSDRFLSPDAQLIRYVGYPPHVSQMMALGNSARVVVSHGVSDDACLVDDTRMIVGVFQAAGMEVDAHIIEDSDVDGKLIKNTGHSVGDRTQLLIHFAGKYLAPDSHEAVRRETPTDFECKDSAVRYTTPNGAYAISYENGYPVGRFEKSGRDSSGPAVFHKTRLTADGAD